MIHSLLITSLGFPTPLQGQIASLDLGGERRALAVSIQPYLSPLDLPAPEDRGHDARIAVAIYDGNHPQGLFIGRVGNQVIVDPNETQRAAG